MKDELAETELTEHEQQKLIRVNEAWTLMRKFTTTADAVAILMTRFEGLSRASAYRDCADAVSLFGDLSLTKKEGLRHLSTEMVKEAYQLAVLQKDPHAMIKAAAEISKINGVNLNDPDTFDWAKLEPHTYVLGIDEQMVKALKSMISNGKIDLTSVVEAMQSQATDAVIISESKND